jgi:hypothetical protein
MSVLSAVADVAVFSVSALPLALAAVLADVAVACVVKNLALYTNR